MNGDTLCEGSWTEAIYIDNRGGICGTCDQFIKVILRYVDEHKRPVSVL